MHASQTHSNSLLTESADAENWTYATEVVNKGTDGYIIKPVVDMDIFINTIREHLKKQEEARRYSEQKVKEFIETRVLQKDRVPKNRSGRRRR